MTEASLLTQVLVAEKYGPRLGTDQLATVLFLLLSQASGARWLVNVAWLHGGARARPRCPKSD